MTSSHPDKGEGSSSRALTEQQARGLQGEEEALAYLQQKGLTLVERNFRCRTGEIDLIMHDHGVIVFVEVRKRGNLQYGGAAASVTATKQARLVSAAQVFLKRYASMPQCRFDVVAIEAGKLNWLKNVIEA
jgi:putative endonuclease